ncbi:MAG: basic amino acid/polyamine antiporter [Propionibacteriaceae bacterium]|jgi:arginine:ornithine antiporter/lysine permease|nr:basic amino acid/polyamine antiporter [Propionibacteriaceae bacterium]
MSTKTTAPAAATSLGLIGLIGIIISAMVGGGIFSLPHDMAASASPGAILVAWVVTGVGMWFVVNTFRILADIKPNLTSGLYTYAESGFGRFMGYLVAWGYWICNCFAIVAYAVLAMSTLNSFFPVFEGGNTVAAILVGSIIIWVIFAITLVGPRGTSIINLVATVGKLIPIIMFIILAVTVFKASLFVRDFWGRSDAGGSGFDFGAVLSQVKPTMLVTLWVFIGIEGAVVVSRRALSQSMVRQATLIGFLVTLALYILVSALPMGMFPGEHLAQMDNPSMATVLLEQFGTWGSTIVSVGVLVSVLASWLVWMMLLGEMPAAAARNGTFPTIFARENRRGTPWVSLLAAAIVIQVVFILTYFSQDAWSLMYSICSVMAMPCYLLTTLYLFKVSRSRTYDGQGHSRRSALIVGLLGSIYGVWLIYAAGLWLAMAACLVYAVSVPLYIVARRQNDPKNPVFAAYEWIVLIIVIALGLAGLSYLIWA